MHAKVTPGYKMAKEWHARTNIYSSHLTNIFQTAQLDEALKWKEDIFTAFISTRRGQKA